MKVINLPTKDNNKSFFSFIYTETNKLILLTKQLQLFVIPLFKREYQYVHVYIKKQALHTSRIHFMYFRSSMKVQQTTQNPFKSIKLLAQQLTGAINIRFILAFVLAS